MLMLTLSLGATPAWAGAPTDAMRDFFGAVNVVLTDPRTEDQPLERLRAIRRHVDDIFDFREAAMLALGREWTARTHAEQNEFVALFADLLERSFVWRLAGKASVDGGVKVQYVGETVAGDTAIVEADVAARDGNDLKLEFRMVRRADRWVVRDLVMYGVSTVENYHAQFQRVVRDSSWRDLMSQMRAKVGAPPVTVQVAGGATGAGSATPPAPVVARLAPSDLDRPGLEDRHAAARDLAAVVTPGLAVRDVARLPQVRQLTAVVAPATPPPPPSREVSAAAPPVAERAAVVSPVREVGVGITPREIGSARRATEIGPAAPARVNRGGDGVSVTTHSPMSMLAAVSALAAVPPAPMEPPRSTRPVIARPAVAPSGYWIQVGAFRNATIASRVAGQVKGEILVAPPVAGDRGEPIMRVRVGPFADRAQAIARMRQLQGLGYQPFIP
jgi:phospholipid transport system substrate-binding protein